MVANRDDDGRYSPSKTDEEVLAAVEDHAPAATSEVGEALGVTRQAADYRLRQLRNRDEVEAKKIGASLVWFTARDAERPTSAPKTADTPVAEPDPPGSTPGGDTAETVDLRALVDDLELEGSGTALEARRETLVEILEYLREEGSASSGDLKDLVDGEDPRLYTDPDSFWANVRRQKVFDDLDVVETPGQGGKTYYYRDRS